MRRKEQHSQHQKSNNKAIIGNQRASLSASLFKDVLLTITGTATRKLQAIKVLKDLFGTGLKETKDLVDMYTDDKLSVTRIPMKKLYTEELDKETMENIERQFKYNGFEIEIKQEYYISFINYYM